MLIGEEKPANVQMRAFAVAAARAPKIVVCDAVRRMNCAPVGARIPRVRRQRCRHVRARDQRRAERLRHRFRPAPRPRPRRIVAREALDRGERALFHGRGTAGLVERPLAPRCITTTNKRAERNHRRAALRHVLRDGARDRGVVSQLALRRVEDFAARRTERLDDRRDGRWRNHERRRIRGDLGRHARVRHAKRTNPRIAVAPARELAHIRLRLR
ncbi:hypothetical protein [Burkholderia sp. ABCPW 111]|uniref:hypothetical protein n=1 Tax=Burkholderia sp. ABCPW 111 TaxID=1820025 RepID=UPI00126A469F|nr:hypothetical protein [Burkholderia sp. ABCPW 111]